MAVAAWLVWRARGWGGALANIVVLDILIIAVMAAFWKVKPLAAALLAPYLAWVSFATALTASVWQRNPGLL